MARIAYRLLGRADEVDDAVQDVFIELARGFDRIHDRQALKGWLAVVTVRAASRRLRKRRVLRWLRLDDGTPYDQVEAPAASPDERDLLFAIYQVLDTVPVAPRTAWVLRMIEGESLERVAELCGCSLATAKRRIRAVQRQVEEGVEAER